MIFSRTNPRFRWLTGLCLVLVAVLFVAESAHAHNVGVRAASRDCTVCAAHQAALPGATVHSTLLLSEPMEVVAAPVRPSPLHRPAKTQFVRPPPVL